MGKLRAADQLAQDLEGRIEKLNTARDWLARTETRLEGVGRKAQEQVQLLESLVKTNGEADKAPPITKRETVTKLAHQGWSVQEIARATKLSRGEVELILEVAPRP